MSVKSEKTKKILAAALYDLLKIKEYNKITITDIVKHAGVNRKTFYYHFHTIEALLAWMIENEAAITVTNLNLDSNLYDTINSILDFLEKNRKLFKSINDSIGRGSAHKLIVRYLQPLISNTIEQIDSQTQTNLSLGYKNFVVEFYTEAIAGVIQNWFEKPILRNREETTEYILRMFKDVKHHSLNQKKI